jgi:hypothetical protein
LRSGPAQFEPYVLTGLPRLSVFAYFKELFRLQLGRDRRNVQNT